jgi:hypothetical protein
MVRWTFSRRERRTTAGRRRFRPVVVGLEERPLLSSLLIGNLDQPVGVTTDSADDLYVSYQDGTTSSGPVDAVAEYTLNSSGQYQFDRNVMAWTGSNNYAGPLVTLGSSADLPVLESGDILELQSNGWLFTCRPSTGGSAIYGSNLTTLTPNGTDIFDFATGQYVDDGSYINLSNADFGDFGVYGDALLVSGEVDSYDFVMRVIYTESDGVLETTSKILVDSPVTDGSTVPKGLAVNANGVVLTSLCDDTGIDQPVAFNARFDVGEAPSPEIPPLLGYSTNMGIDAVGITLDAQDDFVIAVSSSGLLGGGPGYVTISPNLVQLGAAPSTPLSSSSLTPVPVGIAVPANIGGVAFVTDPGLNEVLADNEAMPSYTPAQIAQAYGVNQITFTGPNGTTIQGDGAGQTIAIFDAGYDPGFVDTSNPNYDTSDLAVFDRMFGLANPPDFQQINNQQVGEDPSTLLETTLDVEWAHAIAPDANILLFDFNPSGDDADIFENLMSEIQYATKTYPNISVVSVSYGAGEKGLGSQGYNQKTYDSVFQVPGVTFLISSGDQGAYGDYNISNGTDLSFTPEDPAASPDVIAVGGTSLYLNASGDYPGTGPDGETGWSLGSDQSNLVESSGGGISAIESEPNWQLHVVPKSIDNDQGRAVPDVAWDANAGTGFYIYSSELGGWLPCVGGTSIATPQWAGLIAIADQERVQGDGGTPLTGYDQTLPALYSLPSSDFHNILYGNNGYPVPLGGGYNLVTGLGSPIANLLVPALAAYQSQLVVTAEPPSSITAGQGFGLTITVEDGFGDVVTSYNGPVTIALTNDPGGGSITVTAVDGVATFSGLAVDKAGTGYSLTATGSFLTPAETTTFNVTPAAASKLVVTEEPPSSVTAGAGFHFTITAEDPYGNVATSFQGNVTASLTGYSGGVTVTAVNGVAAYYVDVTLAGSGYTITATSGSLTPAVTTAFNVTPAAASQLIVTTEPPSSVTAGSGFGLKITAEDAYGNVVTSFNGSVTIALGNNPGGSTLGGTLTVTATNGVASFSGLTLNKVGTGYTLKASSGSLTAAITSGISVTPAAASKLVITTEPPSSVAAGVEFGLAVTVEDAYGNVVTGFTGSVTIALGNNPGGSTLGGTLTVAVVDGVATFSNLTLNNPGTGYTLTVRSSGLTRATTNAFNVT